MSTEIFFAADFARGAPKRRQEAEAKAICADCPVIKQCLTRALEINEPYGIWGGKTRDEREALRVLKRHAAA